MTTGTIIMIICAFLYGLIVILFREESHETGNKISNVDRREVDTDIFPGQPGLFCSDGTPGADGLLASDFDKVSSE